MKTKLTLLLLFTLSAAADVGRPESDVHSLDRRAVKDAHRQYFTSSPEKLGELIIYDAFTRQANPAERAYISPQTTPQERALNDRELAAHRLNVALSKYRAQLPVLHSYKNANPGASALKYVDAALDIVGAAGKHPGVKVGTLAGKFGTQIARDVLRETLGPAHQKSLQKGLLPGLSPEYVDRVIDQIYESKDDPNKNYALTRTIGLDARAVPGESAKTVYSRHADLYQQLAAKETNENVRKMYKINAEMYRTISENIGKDGLLHLEINQLKDYFRELSGQQVENIKQAFEDIRAAERAAEYDAHIAQLERQAWVNGAYTITSLIGLANPEMGKFLGNYVKGVTQIADAAQTFQALKGAGKLASAGLTLVTGLVGGLGTIFSLFGGPSELELVMEQLKEIRKSIEELSRYVEYRFNVVDRRLYEIHKTVVENFFELRAHINELEKKLGYIQMSLETYEVAAARRAREMEELIGEISDDNFRLQVLRCNEWSLNRTDKINKELYKFCLDFFYHCATQTAGSKTFTGPTAPSDVKDYLQFLHARQISSETVEQNVGIVGNYTRTFLGNPTLISPPLTSEAPPERFPLNPSRWQICSEKFVLMATDYPDLYQSETGRELNSLLGSGKAIVASYQGLLRDSTGAVRKDTFEKLTKNYKDSVKRLIQDLEGLKNADLMRNDPQSKVTIRGEQVILGTNSYDPWRRDDTVTPDVKRMPLFRALDSAQSIGICGNGKIENSPNPAGFDGQPKLSFPVGILKLIPREYIQAHEMGTGRLTFCYEPPSWENTTTGEQKWYAARNFGVPGNDARLAVLSGNLSVTIHLTFTSQENSASMWYFADSKSTTAYGFVGHSESMVGNPERGQHPVERWKGDNRNWFFDGQQRGSVLEVELARQWDGLKSELRPFTAERGKRHIDMWKNHFALRLGGLFKNLVENQIAFLERRIKIAESFNGPQLEKQRANNTKFLKLQNELIRSHLAYALETDLINQAKLVDTYRGLLEAHVALALPQSLAANARMHSLFFGAHRMPSSQDLANYLKSDVLSTRVTWDLSKNNRPEYLPSTDLMEGCGEREPLMAVSAQLNIHLDPTEYLERLTSHQVEVFEKCLMALVERPNALESYERILPTLDALEKLRGIANSQPR